MDWNPSQLRTVASSESESTEDSSLDLTRRISTAENVTNNTNARNDLRCLPGLCPISECGMILSPDYALCHILQCHVTMQETKIMYSEDEATWKVGINGMVKNKTQLLGIIMYAGQRSGLKPAQRRGFMKNINLTLEQHEWEDHVLILIMGLRTFWEALADKPSAEQEEDIFLAWLVCPYAYPNLVASLTISNESLTTSFSSCVNVEKWCLGVEEQQHLIVEHLAGFCLQKDDIKTSLCCDGLHKLTVSLNEIDN